MIQLDPRCGTMRVAATGVAIGSRYLSLRKRGADGVTESNFTCSDRPAGDILQGRGQEELKRVQI